MFGKKSKPIEKAVEAPKVVKVSKKINQCVTCSGQGLVNDGHPQMVMCPDCSGTGKAH